MAYKQGQCWVCHQTTSVQGHHLAPVEYGGPDDGPKINLCPTCHLVCHYEAEIFYKTGDYGSLNSKYTGAALDRADKVIQRIVTTRLKFEDAGKPAEDARRRLNVNLSHDELLLVHAAKRVMGFRSVDRFVKACIMNTMRQLRKSGKL